MAMYQSQHSETKGAGHAAKRVQGIPARILAHRRKISTPNAG